jgi:release factor glutamine methyltransferase
VHGNLFEGIDERADLIVANPPYVPSSAARGLAPEVVGWEPHAALFSGADGLSLMRDLLDAAAGRLAPGGVLVVEFGFGQEDDVRSIAARAGWRVDRVRADLQGIARTIVLGR